MISKKYNLPKSKGVYIEREIFESHAFWELNDTAFKVMIIFYLKRQRTKRKSNKRDTYVTANNGQIQFTYKEAENKYDIPKSSFLRARDLLIKVGFIEIAETGGYHHPNLYTISNNWMNYPQQNFKRSKSANLVGKDTRWKKKDTLTDDTI